MSTDHEIIYDSRWMGPHGIGRFATELGSRLPNLSKERLTGSPTSPFDCVKLSWKLWRSNCAFFSPGFNAPLNIPFTTACPFVFAIHDLIHVNHPAEASLSKRLYYKFVVRPAARNAFRVLTVSEFSKREIVQWAGIAPDQVEVVYNGVGKDFNPNGSKNKHRCKYVFYVGNQKPHKNFDGLLDAMTHIRNRADIELIVTGKATTETSQKIHRLGLDGHVQFLGNLTDEELAQTYRGAAVTVLASEYEGFGLPVIESMACGTPVVCSNVTSLPEIAGDAAELVSTDAMSIANGVLRVLGSEQLRQTLVASGLRRAAEFTWDATAAKVLNVLNQLATSNWGGNEIFPTPR